MKTHSVSLRMDGRYITDSYRDIVLSERWTEAVEMLSESLSDDSGNSLPLNRILDILSGKSCLANDGQGGIKVDKEDDDVRRSYQQELSEVYAGCYLKNGKWYQPFCCTLSDGLAVERDGALTSIEGEELKLYKNVRNFRSVRDEQLKSASQFIRHYDSFISEVLHITSDEARNEFKKSFIMPSEGKARIVVLFEEMSVPPPSFLKGVYNVTTPKSALSHYLEFAGPLPYKKLPRIEELKMYERRDAEEMGLLNIFEWFSISHGTTMGRCGPSASQSSIGEEGCHPYKLLGEESEEDDSESSLPKDSSTSISESSRKAYLKSLKDSLPRQYSKKEEEEIRKKIISKAEKEGGFIELFYQGVTYKIAKIPFMLWGYNMAKKSGFSDEIYDSLPEWSTISPESFKMLNDNPLHTDWMLSAGITSEQYYGSSDFSTFLVASATDFFMPSGMNTPQPFFPLSGQGVMEGKVRFIHSFDDYYEKGEILVIPNADVDYFNMVKNACEGGVGGVVTETGSPAAHLSVNAGEYAIKVALMENAKEKLMAGVEYKIDLEEVKFSPVAEFEMPDKSNASEMGR